MDTWVRVVVCIPFGLQDKGGKIVGLFIGFVILVVSHIFESYQ